MRRFRNLSVLTLAGMLAAPAAFAATVTANNAGGDAFTNPGPTNTGQAVGSSGWYYNNVRVGGTVGINGSHPRSGNGSVSFSTPVPPGASTTTDAKADIEYLSNAQANANGNYAATGSLGQFSALSAMAYEWYRDSTSTNNPGQHPSLRVLLDADGNLGTTGDVGGLVFERAYNGGGPAPADQWVSEFISSSTYMWNFGLGLGFLADIDSNNNPHDSTLADWQRFLNNAVIIGFSSGVGSGWGAFSGAVDNISWTIGGVTTSTNFELAANAVPEPVSLSLLAFGLAGIRLSRRKSR